MFALDNKIDLCLNWVALLVATALVAFGLGMMYAQVRFDFEGFATSLNPATITAMAIGVCFHICWMFAVIRRTLSGQGRS